MMRIPHFLCTLGLGWLALCPAGQTAHAQVAAVPYWSSTWPIGFGGNLGTNSGFSGLDGGEVEPGWFVGGVRSGAGLNFSGTNQWAALGNNGSLHYEGVQFGYKFQNAPLSFYAGFDTLKYNTGLGSPFAPFDNVSGTLPGYRAQAGVEFRPTSNLSLSLGVGFTQQPGRLDSDINSPLLPGASAFPLGRR